MSMFELYAIFVLIPAISGVGVILVKVGMLGGVLCAIATGITAVEDEFEAMGVPLKLATKCLLLCISVGTLLSLAPDEDQVKFLAGGYVVTNVEGMSELPENIVESANTFLKSINEQENN